MLYISPYIQLWESERNRNIPGSNATHLKGYDAYPSRPIEDIQFQHVWNEWANGIDTNGPVSKEENMPAHKE